MEITDRLVLRQISDQLGDLRQKLAVVQQTAADTKSISANMQEMVALVGYTMSIAQDQINTIDRLLDGVI